MKLRTSPTTSPRKLAKRAETCSRKIPYSTWEEAEGASREVWRKNPRENDANGPLPYPCDQPGPRHYHIGHLKGRGRGE